MKYLVGILFVISTLYSCSKTNNAHVIEKPKAQLCSVSSVSGGALISCPDGSSTFIKDGQDGTNGSNGTSCSVEQLSNGAKISCQDGTFAYIFNGQDGEDGKDGADGSSCTVSSTPNGALITCDDGSSVAVNNGQNGQSCSIQDVSNGAIITCGNNSAIIYDGEDALAGAIGIASYIYPCGKEFNSDEILLRLTDGNILALFDGGPHEDRLTLMYPGNFITTDRNKNHTCNFTIDANLNITNEYVD